MLLQDIFLSSRVMNKRIKIQRAIALLHFVFFCFFWTNFFISIEGRINFPFCLCQKMCISCDNEMHESTNTTEGWGYLKRQRVQIVLIIINLLLLHRRMFYKDKIVSRYYSNCSNLRSKDEWNKKMSLLILLRLSRLRRIINYYRNGITYWC